MFYSWSVEKDVLLNSEVISFVEKSKDLHFYIDLQPSHL